MLALLTLTTMVAFAANSILCRMALAGGSIDPAAFTAIRLASGAAVLLPLAAFSAERRETREPRGSWPSAVALVVYALGFSLAYVSLDAGVGALILFGAVQATMIGTGVARGERPRLAEWGGLGLAMAGLVYLVRPGMSAPDPLGAALMLAAGIGWGAYSIRGQGSRTPIASTAGNFLRSVPFALVALFIASSSLHVTPGGVYLAVLSGAVTSGLGYVLWYAALRRLTTTRAAIVQLSVPVLAAAGGIAFLAEPATLRLAVSSVMILGGIALAILTRGRDRQARPSA